MEYYQMLHERAVLCAKKYRTTEIEFFNVLQEIDTKKVFRWLGYSSLFKYTVDALKLSESQALNFINVARKAMEVPELKTAVQSGALSISKARKVVPVINKQNQENWIQKAIELPQRDLEKAVACAQPELVVSERVRPVAYNRSELKCGISHELESKLEKIKNLLAQKTRKAVSIEDALNVMADSYLEKHDPVKRATRILQRKDLKPATLINLNLENQASQEVKNLEKPVARQVRSPMPAILRHQVNLRDSNRCTFTNPNGQRCESERWLETHHCIPVSKGGGNTLENLITLCANHHKYLHLH